MVPCVSHFKELPSARPEGIERRRRRRRRHKKDCSVSENCCGTGDVLTDTPIVFLWLSISLPRVATTSAGPDTFVWIVCFLALVSCLLGSSLSLCSLCWRPDEIGPGRWVAQVQPSRQTSDQLMLVCLPYMWGDFGPG